VIRVLLVDDHESVREGLRLLLNAQPDISVVGEAGDGHAALELTRQVKPDVLVLDLTMPHLGGLMVARALASETSPAVVAFTRHDDEAYVHELLAANARGFVLKQSPSAVLLRAVRAAAAGERYIDPALPSLEHPRGRQGRTSPPSLTERETEVLRMAATGHSNKEIASSLDISVKTAEVHKSNAMRKMGLAGRTDVVRYAVLKGWLRDP
jgi:DNA-binding NarL/FixJ family response regulator